jgi:hypothetical protein
MKQLFAGIVLIVLIGVGGFFYRNVKEKPGMLAEQPVCTRDAKLCPDGTSVGRQGPSCTFAPCAAPNVEVIEVGLGFVLPAGYAQIERGSAAQETLRIFQKPASSPNAPHLITIKRYPIPEGKTANEVILENTRFQPSDMPADDMADYKIVVLNGKTFYGTVIERFEGQVESSYFLPRTSDVLRFDLLERDVTTWMEPAMVIEQLPEHAALLQMLGTVQTN